MTAVEAGQIIGLASAVVLLIQAVRAVYQNLRAKDEALVQWGNQVITMMTGMEELFAPYLSDDERKKMAFKASLHAGELLDQGRLFFRNVTWVGVRGGYRVRILDQIVRASYIANAIAYSRIPIDDTARLKLWDSRKEFVKLLQQEMRWSLRRRKKDEAGQSINHDPAKWIAPNYEGWWQ